MYVFFFFLFTFCFCWWWWCYNSSMKNKKLIIQYNQQERWLNHQLYIVHKQHIQQRMQIRFVPTIVTWVPFFITIKHLIPCRDLISKRKSSGIYRKGRYMERLFCLSFPEWKLLKFPIKNIEKKERYTYVRRNEDIMDVQKKNGNRTKKIQ